jgi:hypothetical protein
MLGGLTLALTSKHSLIVAGKAESLLNQARHCSTEKSFQVQNTLAYFCPTVTYKVLQYCWHRLPLLLSSKVGSIKKWGRG